MSNSLKKLYLKKYVRFRKENGEVFVCNLYNLDNYSFPLKDFKKLEVEGLDDDKNDFLEDLKQLGMIDYTREIDLNNNNAFNKLIYNESEFFN